MLGLGGALSTKGTVRSKALPPLRPTGTHGRGAWLHWPESWWMRLSSRK